MGTSHLRTVWRDNRRTIIRTAAVACGLVLYAALTAQWTPAWLLLPVLVGLASFVGTNGGGRDSQAVRVPTTIVVALLAVLGSLLYPQSVSIQVRIAEWQDFLSSDLPEGWFVPTTVVIRRALEPALGVQTLWLAAAISVLFLLPVARDFRTLDRPERTAVALVTSASRWVAAVVLFLAFIQISAWSAPSATAPSAIYSGVAAIVAYSIGAAAAGVLRRRFNSGRDEQAADSLKLSFVKAVALLIWVFAGLSCAILLAESVLDRSPGWKWTALIALAVSVIALLAMKLVQRVRTASKIRQSTAANTVLAGMLALTLLAGIVPAFTAPPVREAVVSADLSGLDYERDGVPGRDELRQILVNSSQYSVETWYPTQFQGQQPGAILDFGGVLEHDIRPAATAAFGLAVALKSGALAESKVSVADAMAVTKQLVRSLGYRHWANADDAWGSETSWQGALWAELAGFAAWLVWEDLPASTQELVSTMMVAEANRFLDYDVPYWKDPNGVEQFLGDSKAEENSWNSMLLQVTMAMMPGHPNWEAWNESNTELMLSSFATPNDETSTREYSGRPLKDWLNGSNMENDGRVYNHEMLHPDYMTTIMHNMHMILTASLAGQKVPSAALHNVGLMWDAFTVLEFESPPYVEPGGTIYNADDASFYYPEGTDWGRSRRMQFVGMDAFYWAFAESSEQRNEAGRFLPLHAAQALQMQQRFDDGRTYGPDDDDVYRSREQWVAMYAAWSYLAIGIGQDFQLSH